MTIIDAEKFLAYLIFSKHIDGLTCGEVKEAIEMCKVDEVKVDDVLDKIRSEIKDIIQWYMDHGQEDCSQVLTSAIEIIDKYRKESEET